MRCEHWETEPINGRDNYYWYTDGTEAGFLCDECATSAGFCPMCGAFVAGSSDDHTMMDYGMCSECWDELDSYFEESYPDDSWGDGKHFGEPYPTEDDPNYLI